MISRPINRLAARLYPDVGWGGHWPGATAVIEVQYLPCGCQILHMLRQRGLTWTWSLEVICAQHAVVSG